MSEEEDSISPTTGLNRPNTTVMIPVTELKMLKDVLYTRLKVETSPAKHIIPQVQKKRKKVTTPTNSMNENIIPVNHYIKQSSINSNGSSGNFSLMQQHKPHIAKKKKKKISVSSKKKSRLTENSNRWKMIGVFEANTMETINIALIGNSSAGKKAIARKFTGAKFTSLMRTKSEGNLFYRFVRLNQKLIEVNFSHILHADNSYTMDHLNEQIKHSRIDAYILCFAVDDKGSYDVLFNRVAEEISKIDVPVYLCGTKAETPHEFREVSFNMGKQLCDKIPNCRGFYETSIIRKGDKIISGYDSDDEEECEVATEDSSGGIDFLFHEILKEVYTTRFNESKFAMAYKELSGEEYSPYIPQLEQLIDVYSTAADVPIMDDEEPEQVRRTYGSSAPTIYEGVGGAGLLRDLALGRPSISASESVDELTQDDTLTY
jgi:GTPase SAR1 family protein